MSLTALALVPDWRGPRCKFLQHLRARHDPQAAKWPPHINICYPFVPDATGATREQLHGLPTKLRVEFRRVGCFKNKGSSVAYLVPEAPEALQALQAEAQARFGLPAPKRAFVPHLTVGKFATGDECEAFIHALPPFVIAVDLELCVLTRPDLATPFTVFGAEARPYALEDPLKAVVPPPQEYWQTDGANTRLVLSCPGGAAPVPTLCVIDKSGSMGGAWAQVQKAVQYMQQGKQPLAFVLYDEQAKRCSGADVMAARPGNMTSFKAAFDEIKTWLATQGPCQVVFMTDGQDNRSPGGAKQCLADLKKALEPRADSVVFHAIGFTTSHNRELLEGLVTTGASGGVYRFAQPDRLEERFAEMFDFLEVCAKVPVAIGGQSFELEACRGAHGLVVDAFLPLALDCGEVEVGGVTKRLEQRPVDCAFAVRKVDATAIATQQELDAAQTALQEVNTAKAPKAEREQVFALKQEAQARLDKFHAAFAAAARQRVGATEGLAAELSSLRHEATFRKARRARAMDRRVAVNESAFELCDALLQSLPRDPIGVDLSCQLSGQTVDECMEDSHRDFFVFAMRVRRTEDVIDAPTDLQLTQVCAGTYASSAFQEGVKHALQAGGAKAHGGFADRGVELAEDVGLFRGPDGALMNACLPLHLDDAHFARVRVQIKPVLGYFFTLDPLGYHPDQLIALYGVLGQVLLRHPERQAWLEWVVSDFAKLCAGLLPLAKEQLAAGYGGQVRACLSEAFLAGPHGRTKQALPNLAVLLGWRHACGHEDDARFKTAFVEELWRRNLTQMYKGQPRDAIQDALKDLLYGRADDRAPLQPVSLARANSPDFAPKPRGEKAKQFAQWGKLVTDRLSQKQAAQLRKQFPRGPEVEPCAAETRAVRRIKAYEEDAAFFDEVVAAQLAQLEAKNRFCAPLLGGAPLGEGFDGATKRRMLLQALMHVGNGCMSDAVQAGTYKNTFDHPDAAVLCEHQHARFEQQRAEKLDALREQEHAYQTAKRIAHAATMDEFLGRLSVSCPTRGGMVFERVVALLCAQPAPELADKVAVLMTGKAHGCGVLGGGSSWVHCSAETVQKLRDQVGEEPFGDIELQMHGKWGWVYRQCDTPNRHGHCNSNPNPSLVTEFKGFR